MSGNSKMLDDADFDLPRDPFDEAGLDEIKNRLDMVKTVNAVWGQMAARKLWTMLQLPDVKPGKRRRKTAPQDELHHYLVTCLSITGKTDDWLVMGDLWIVYKDWCAKTARVPVDADAFRQWMKDQTLMIQDDDNGTAVQIKLTRRGAAGVSGVIIRDEWLSANLQCVSG